MSRIFINQTVDVRWRLPSAQGKNGVIGDDVVTRTFENLIPACEFAVAMAKEGNLDVNLYPDKGPALALGDARRIKDAWESGKAPLEAEEIEY